eukprot:15351603-Alexandrium_andersonii.AAC.1
MVTLRLQHRRNYHMIGRAVHPLTCRRFLGTSIRGGADSHGHCCTRVEGPICISIQPSTSAHGCNWPVDAEPKRSQAILQTAAKPLA